MLVGPSVCVGLMRAAQAEAAGHCHREMTDNGEGKVLLGPGKHVKADRKLDFLMQAKLWLPP